MDLNIYIYIYIFIKCISLVLPGVVIFLVTYFRSCFCQYFNDVDKGVDEDSSIIIPPPSCSWVAFRNGVVASFCFFLVVVVFVVCLNNRSFIECNAALVESWNNPNCLRSWSYNSCMDKMGCVDPH